MFFYLCGFHLIPSEKLGQKILNSFVFIGHICICLWCSFTAYTFFVQIQVKYGILRSISFLLYDLSCITLYWIIIFNCYFNQKNRKKIWEIFTKINTDFLKSFEKWSYTIILALILVVNVANNVLLMASYMQYFEIWLMILIYRILCDQHLFFYILHLKFITFQLQQLNAKLQQMRESGQFGQIQSQNMNKIDLKWIRIQYNFIYEMSERMNTTFGWSILVSSYIVCFRITILSLYLVRKFNENIKTSDLGINLL